MAQSELQLQSECFLWTWNQLPQTRGCVWHVTNEVKPFPEDTFEWGSQTVIYPGESKKNLSIRIAKAKAAGLVPGVADLHFMWGGRLYVFELKVAYNKLSPEQERWRDAVVAQGAVFYLIRSAAEFKSLFLSIINKTT